MALKNPLSLAVDAALGTISIAKMVVGQVGRTVLSTAGRVVTAVLERQEEPSDADASGSEAKPSSTPHLHTVPPVAVRVDTEAKQHGDPVAPTRRTSPAKKTAESNVDPASKQQGDPTAPQPKVGRHTSPAKKASPAAKRASARTAPTKEPAPARTAAPGVRKAAPGRKATAKRSTSTAATAATEPVTATPADVAEVLSQSPAAKKAASATQATGKKAGEKKGGAKKASAKKAGTKKAGPTATKKATAGGVSPLHEPVSTPGEDTVVYSSESTEAPEHLAQPLLDPSLAEAVRNELSSDGPADAAEDADQS